MCSSDPVEVDMLPTVCRTEKEHGAGGEDAPKSSSPALVGESPPAVGDEPNSSNAEPLLRETCSFVRKLLRKGPSALDGRPSESSGLGESECSLQVCWTSLASRSLPNSSLVTSSLPSQPSIFFSFHHMNKVLHGLMEIKEEVSPLHYEVFPEVFFYKNEYTK